MQNMLVYPIGTTAACLYAAKFLEQNGMPLIDHPTPEVTHVLLDIPSFGPGGELRGGGSLEKVLERLPQTVGVIGGNLSHPALENHSVSDLLKDAQYLAENAAITADCALQVAAPLLKTTLADSPALIIGWGRIGKCLGHLLKSVGTDVTIAARKETDRAMIRALGFNAVDLGNVASVLPKCRLLFNTAPELVLTREELERWNKCVKIDLASQTGIEGPDVVWARGLPGVYAPESSGQLIAKTILRLMGRN